MCRLMLADQKSTAGTANKLRAGGREGKLKGKEDGERVVDSK
jgi:hypothetical protein